MLKTLILSLALVSFSFGASASQAENYDEPNFLDELDPFDPNVEETLQMYDEYYEEMTGEPSHIDQDSFESEFQNLLQNVGGCYRTSCAVYILVKKSEQKAYLYLNGAFAASWLVSTGTAGHGTPNFDKHPNGRIYNKYSSSKYPGGDYNGLGNMPYAVFIQGGFALHGTPRGNWKRLGSRASHGCIRMHPDNAKYFNGLVRSVGISQTWITVQ